MIIYKGKNKNLKKIYQLCTLEYKHEDGRVREVKGFYHDVVRYAAEWIESGQEFSIKPCEQSDLFETQAVTSGVNEAILVIQSTREYAERLDKFYENIFERPEKKKTLSDFTLFWEIRKRWTGIKYIGSDTYGYFNGWVEEPEFMNLMALELIERFREEHGGEDDGKDEVQETGQLAYNLHR